jgi:hypothetical protein
MTSPNGPVFLGARRLDLDTGEQLPSRFAELYADVVTAVDRFRRGDDSPEQAAARLAQLRCLDESGVEWTVGASTLSWYARRPGGEWAPSSAPVQAVQRSLPSADGLDIDDIDDDVLARIEEAGPTGEAAGAELEGSGRSDAEVLDRLTDHLAALDDAEDHSESWEGEFSLGTPAAARSSADFSHPDPHGDTELLLSAPSPVRGPADLGGPSSDGIGGASVDLRELDLDEDLLALLDDPAGLTAPGDSHAGDSHAGDEDTSGPGYADAT